MKKHITPEPRDWLEQAYPQMHFLLLALDGDPAGARWLAQNSEGVGWLSRALSGDEQAQARLEQPGRLDLDDLFEVIENEDVLDWLRERRADLFQLFRAIKGDEAATAPLGRKKSPLARLVAPLHQAREAYLARGQNEDPLLEGGALADMGCLIGEMHLRQGEYEKAVEAFTRALETRPDADLYEGRARAYRGMAEQDEDAARLMRQRPR